MDKQSKEVIGYVQSLLPKAREFQSYAEESREELEQILLRSQDSWEALVGEALQFSKSFRWGLKCLNERIAETQAEEAKEVLKSLPRPIPGTEEFDDCQRQAQIASLTIRAAQETLQKLQRIRDSVPHVDQVKEGVVKVLQIGLPHVAEGVRRTVSVEANRIQSLAIDIDGKMIAFEELVARAEDLVGKKLKCPTFNRQLIEQLLGEEVVELA